MYIWRIVKKKLINRKCHLPMVVEPQVLVEHERYNVFQITRARVDAECWELGEMLLSFFRTGGEQDLLEGVVETWGHWEENVILYWVKEKKRKKKNRIHLLIIWRRNISSNRFNWGGAPPRLKRLNTRVKFTFINEIEILRLSSFRFLK